MKPYIKLEEKSMYSKSYPHLSIAFIIVFNLFLINLQASIQVNNLRTEMLKDPIGIDNISPKLSWNIQSDRRGIYQKSYQIIVASTFDKLMNGEGDLWDSGKVNSNQSIHIKYNGFRLKSRDKCYWKVRVWTEDEESAWSEPAKWTMGLLHHNDWISRWIGFDRSFSWDREDKFSRLSARYFRNTFFSDKEVSEARIYIIGLGLYELFLNGQKVGNQVLAPSPTDYHKNIKYNIHDVTDMINSGENAIGIILGNGRYYTMRQFTQPYKIKNFGYPKLLFQLEIDYNDGTREVIKSDDTWRGTADGPIRSNNEYDGEEYDARKEMKGWNTIEFDDSSWLKAEYVQEPEGKYEAQINPNIKIKHTMKPISIEEINPGIFILDMGQNMVGWLRLKVKGERGDQVTLRFAEILNKNGKLETANLRDARATDKYTLKGNDEEIWEPSFVYHGFRFVEITGYPGIPKLSDFEGIVVYDDMETIGHIETSSDLLNQIYKNAWWSITGNYKGMPIDCPQRNERQPWLGDRSTVALGESFMLNNYHLYSKWMDDIKYSQRSDGSIPDVAPAFWRYYSDNMTWAGTYLMTAKMLYQQFGDVEVLKKHYPYMKLWLKYMQDRYLDENYILTKDSYGDWCAPPKTIEEGRGKNANIKYPSTLISTAYYYYYLKLMQDFALLTGNDVDIDEYVIMANKVRTSYNNTFFKVDSMYYGNNSLTENIISYCLGLVPDNYSSSLFSTIENIIEKRNKGHLSTGIIGTQWIIRSLIDGNRSDLAFKLATNITYPSWGYMVENGATTIWELWNGNTAAPNMNSYNHVMMLGDLIIWYFENLAGIKTGLDPTESGFKKIIMKPDIDNLTFVKASYHSFYGLIESKWEKTSTKFIWQVSIPGSTSAVLYFPKKYGKSLSEGGNNINNVDGIRILEENNSTITLEIGSGNYNFELK